VITIKKIKWYFWIIGIAVIALIIVFGGKLYMPKDNTKELAEVQIKDYQGEKLSSIAEFQENSIKGPQYVDINNYKLSITGLVNNEEQYTYDKVINDYQSYSKVVTLYCVEGWNVKLLWEGVLIKDLLNEAGIRQDANTVIFHCYDGYTTSLSLDFVISHNILLAYKMNDITIPKARGYPFMVVAEAKLGYKWAKWVTGIELSNNSDYKGYWESAGYSVNGDLNPDENINP
jgi:DMSO/TMAO reductase YedYZ molybdopterin-dependent catalytic subunit